VLVVYIEPTIHINIYVICTLHIRVLCLNCSVVWKLVRIMIFIIPYTFFEVPRYINFYGMLLQFFLVLLGSGVIIEELINVCWTHTIKKDFPKQLSENPHNTFRWAFHTNLQVIKFNPCAIWLYLMPYWMYVLLSTSYWLHFKAIIMIFNIDYSFNLGLDGKMMEWLEPKWGVGSLQITKIWIFVSLIFGTLCNSYLAQCTYAYAHISKFIIAFQVFHTFLELELQSFNLSYSW
jgi:hypothetical protein